MAQSGHSIRADECLLLGVKRTLNFSVVMSANDPKAIFCALLVTRGGLRNS
jgi:hypothetical protein